MKVRLVVSLAAFAACSRTHAALPVLAVVWLLGCIPHRKNDRPKIDGSEPRPPQETPKQTEEAPDAANDCAALWAFDSNSSILTEKQRMRSNLFPKRYLSAKIETESFPVKTVERFRLQDQPVLWFTPDKADVVVDFRFSQDLEVVDTFRLQLGQRKVFGVLAPAALRGMPPRQILELLIRADVLRTYRQFANSLCLERDEGLPAGYRAEVSGNDVYYTNEKNHETFAFEFEILARPGVGSENDQWATMSVVALPKDRQRLRSGLTGPSGKSAPEPDTCETWTDCVVTADNTHCRKRAASMESSGVFVRGTMCGCVEHRCLLTEREPVPCTRHTDCWFQEDSRSFPIHPLARPKSIRHEFRRCIDGSVEPRCDRGVCGFGAHWKC